MRCSHCSSDWSSCARDLLVEYWSIINSVVRTTGKTVYNCSHGEGLDLPQSEHADECGHLGRLVSRLLERRLSFWRQPILVVALCG